MQSQQDFNSICFHRRCISESNQLFLSTPHSVSPHQAHQQHHTLTLHRKSFVSKFILSHRLIKTRLRKLVKEGKRDFDDMICSLVAQLRKRYTDGLLKQAKILLKELGTQGGTKLIKRLRRRSCNRRDDDLEAINVLNEEKIKGINNLIEKKLHPITSSVDISINSLANKFYQVIPAHFAQMVEDYTAKNTVKIEQQEESRSEEPYIVPSYRPQEQVNDQPIEEEKIDREEQEPVKIKVRKRRNQWNQLDFAEFQRTRTRKNYVQLHNYGRISENEKVDTFIVQNISLLRQLMKEHLIKPCNLVVNCSIDTEELTEAINSISPLRLILNADFQQEHFFEKISQSVLSNLLVLEQRWGCGRFFEEYMNSLFFPTKNQQALKKLRIPVGVWKQLSKIENLCISNANDLSDLKKSKKSLSQIRSLQIQSCPLTKQTFPLEILHLTSQVSGLETLVFRNVNLAEHYTELVFHLLRQNTHIQTLVFENIDSIPNDIVKELGNLPLNKLVIHFEVEGNLDLSFIVSISSLEYLSLKNVRPSYTKQIPSFKLKHLDLYGCGKDSQDVIQYLCGQAPRTLTHLTVAKNQLSNDFGIQLKSFPHLTHLNLDHSSLNLYLFLNTLNKSMIQLQCLSLLGFLDFDDNNFEESTCLLRSEELEKMLLKHFPKLTYLNLSSKESIIKAKGLHTGATLCLKGVKQN